jgi:DNA repair protein SbcD/Mre11
VRSHESVLTAAMERVRADLFLRPGARSVVLAHAFVGGGVPSESERDICVGGVDLVPAAVFDGVDYVALGHLHRPQTLTPRLRYSGSPLAYSFGEAGQQKQVWLVDLDAGGLADVRAVPLPAPRPLEVLTGTLEELLGDPAHAPAEEAFVSARLTDAVRPADPMRRLQGRFPHCVHLEWTGGGRPDGVGQPGGDEGLLRGGVRRVAQQPADHPVEDGGGVGRGHRAVVDVAGDQHDVDRLAGDHRGQPAEHRLLLGEQLGAVQGPPEVPVGGVQQPHGAGR